MRSATTLALVVIALSGCAGSPQRPSPSTVGCAQSVVAQLPAGLTDPQKHCLASAGIAHRCSAFEAWLAGWGKEMQDAFGSGDASFADLQDNRRGRDCARRSDDPDAWRQCCLE